MSSLSLDCLEHKPTVMAGQRTVTYYHVNLVSAELQVGEFAPGSHPELRVRLVEVVPDGPRAEEELRGDVLVGQPLRGQPDDLQLLRGEARGRAVLGRPAAGPGGGQLGPGALGPRGGADPFEGLERDPELGPGVGLALLPAQPLAVQQPGPRLVERPAVLLVQGERRQEQVFVTVEEGPAALAEGRRPGLAGGARPRLEQRQR